jgi:hypothetical protein
MATRGEHLEWARTRALEYAGAGDVAGAVASLTCDLGKHPGTAGHPALETMTALAGQGAFTVPGRLREFIEGFR